MLILQRFFCCILNFFCGLTRSISHKTRNKLVTVMFALLSVCSYFYTISSVSVHLLLKCIIGAILFGGVIIFSIEGEIKPIVWDKKIMVLWMVFGILRVITGVVTSVEFLPLACIWLFAFPMFFLVWNNRKDYDLLFECVYKGFVYPCIVFMIFSLLFRGISDTAYTGLTSNANSLGQHLCAVIALILVKYGFSKNKKERFTNFIIVCAILAFAFFSKSRTTAIAILCACMILFLYQAIILKEKIRKVLGRILLLTVGTAAAVVLCLGVNAASMNIVGAFQNETVKQAKVDKLLKSYADRVEGKDKHAAGIDNYSSGRVNIWGNTVKKLNLLGHPSREHIVTERNSDVGAFVHNNFLQFAYDNGIIAGGVFMLLVIVGGFKVLRMSIKYKQECVLLVLLLHVIYFIVSFFTTINLPFLYQISFLYYLSYIVLAEREEGIEKSALIEMNEKNIRNKIQN